MKNRSTIILLLVAVLAIWGVLFYKIFNGLYGRDVPIPLRNSSAVPSFPDTIDRFYSIHNYSSDPFLDILNDTATVIEEVQSTPIIKVPRPVPKELPAYMGTIQSATKVLCVFRHNKRYYFVAKGDTFLHFRLTTANSDSAIVSFENNLLSIRVLKTGK